MVSQFAYLVLATWPIVVYALFRRLPLQEALIWSICAGYLLLPAISLIDPPLLPSINKTFMLNMSAAVMCISLALAAAKQNPNLRQRPGMPVRQIPSKPTGIEPFEVQRGQILFWSLLMLMFCGTILTVMDNSERLVQGTRVLSGLRPYDALSINVGLLITIAPFLLARRFLASPEAHEKLLKILVLALLAYTLLILWELRMSPQLNKQIYGFGPHKWTQAVRGSGYRPVVFMSHGLRLAILLTITTLAAMALWRIHRKSSEGAKWLAASIYLLVVLFLCKSLGAFFIALLLLPVILLFGVQMQLLVAAIFAGIILVYPMLRGADYVPTEKIYNLALSISDKRAHSIQYRFDNEDLLLAHANKKPVSGWGTWGRNRVFNEKGVDVAATDGLWVIIVGVYGWLGYIAQFGLICIALILLALNRHRFQVSYATAGLAVILAGAMIDQIPNSTRSSITWMLAGALMGRYQTAKAVKRETNIRRLAAHQEASDPEPEAEDMPDDQPVIARRPNRGTLDRPLHVRRPREG